MAHVLDVEATPSEVLDLFERVVEYHSGSIKSDGSSSAVGTFNAGLFSGKRGSELSVSVLAVGQSVTRVQIESSGGEADPAAQTLIDGLEPHAPAALLESPGSSEIPSSAFCTQCGSPLGEGAAHFCTQCGTPAAETGAVSIEDHDKTVVAEDDDEVAGDETATEHIPPVYDTPGWEIATMIDEPEPPRIEARLVIDDAEEVSISLLPGEEFTAGRDMRVATWTPEDLRVSRRHFRLIATDNGITIEDLASSNGTYVNGAFVREPQPLLDGDIVEIGHIRAVFRIDRAPESAT